MVSSLSVLVASLCAANVDAFGEWLFGEKRVEIFNRRSAPMLWEMGEPARQYKHMAFAFALKQRNLDVLENRFWAVATPGRRQYREFMTKEEIFEMIAPPQADADVVLAWLAKHDVTNCHHEGDAIKCPRVKVATAQKLFKTKIYDYHTNEGSAPWHVMRAYGSASIPETVHEKIDFVEGLVEFPMPRDITKTKRQNLKKPDDGIIAVASAQSLAALYGWDVNEEIVYTPNETIQMAMEFQGEASFAYSDLEKFFRNSNLTNQGICNVIGPFDSSYPSAESTLDVQYLAASGLGATNWFYTTDQWMYYMTQDLFAMDTVPHVISMSYGWSEAQQCRIGGEACQQLGLDNDDYVKRINTEFQKLGLRGTSIFVSSGDSGVNGRTDGGCDDPTFHATFPGGSPYVTSVGGTEMKPGTVKYGFQDIPICKNYANESHIQCFTGGKERAISYDQNSFASGGGFSNISVRPSYQDAAVLQYFANAGDTLPPQSMWAKGGRGFPDVASLGANYLTEMQDSPTPVSGTSASAPMWAGLASRLINIAQQNDGKPLGFLNPLLYKAYAANPASFNDITEGDNKCTENGCADSCQGFTCVKGWDPVTGLGSPNYPTLAAYVNLTTRRSHSVAAAPASEVVRDSPYKVEEVNGRKVMYFVPMEDGL